MCSKDLAPDIDCSERRERAIGPADAHIVPCEGRSSRRGPRAPSRHPSKACHRTRPDPRPRQPLRQRVGHSCATRNVIKSMFAIADHGADRFFTLDNGRRNGNIFQVERGFSRDREQLHRRPLGAPSGSVRTVVALTAMRCRATDISRCEHLEDRVSVEDMMNSCRAVDREAITARAAPAVLRSRPHRHRSARHRQSATSV